LPASEFHLIESGLVFAEVILPLAIGRPYTYAVPEALVPQLQVGMRAEVQFGRQKVYTGLVVSLHRQPPEHQRYKWILSVIDEQPIVLPTQFTFWRWLADYYLSTLGEVMHAALPANFKLGSETQVTLGPLFHDDASLLGDKEYLIAEALSIQQVLSIEDIQGILGQKTVYPIIKRLLEKKIIYLQEELEEKYHPKKVGCVRLAAPFAEGEGLAAAFSLTEKAARQTEVLLAYFQLSKKQDYVRRQELLQLAGADNGVLLALAKKGILELYEREVSRLAGYEEETVSAGPLSAAQETALVAVQQGLTEKGVVLLHGVTGSGKTRIYLELIREHIERGEQVLYLLPEIALTAQLIDRLQRVFGNDIAVYHSRLNHNERVELWNSTLQGRPIIMGARSALFLPFQKLGLIIIDEEHDASFKQQDPAPRYHGRDAAIYLAQLHGARSLLGTATPAAETYYNALTGKYALVRLEERFGGLQMPAISMVDCRRALQEQRMHAHFSSDLLDALKATLAAGEQAILFQNRRGYSPAYRCETCGWHSECINCDVSLTYHKLQHLLKCHYCGYSSSLPKQCPACASPRLSLQGFGSEKVEDDLKIYLPEARIARMDADTVRGKYALSRLIQSFEEGGIDILVGTQMVTKGLDFDRVGLVAVLSADQLLQFPDFRASERAFQLMTQVAGRAGRKHRQGKVLIQAVNTAHPVLKEVLNHDFASFIQRELQERKDFHYPPFSRLIRITLKHKDPRVVNEAMLLFSNHLKAALGDWVLGPAVPYVGRVRGLYLLDLLVKIDRSSAKIGYAKNQVKEAVNVLQTTQGMSAVRINIDVDPF
jgi:primosomal protein N' (replication factor Y) (superfamily II helicase)